MGVEPRNEERYGRSCFVIFIWESGFETSVRTGSVSSEWLDGNIYYWMLLITVDGGFIIRIKTKLEAKAGLLWYREQRSHVYEHFEWQE
jgi:hypothetical protein